jgi:hypothetical protein
MQQRVPVETPPAAIRDRLLGSGSNARLPKSPLRRGAFIACRIGLRHPTGANAMDTDRRHRREGEGSRTSSGR